MISDFLNLLRLVLWLNMCSYGECYVCTWEECIFCRKECVISVRSVCLNCSSGPVFSLLIFCFYFVYLELCQELRIMSNWNRVAYEYPVQILMCFASGTYVLIDFLYNGHLQGFLHWRIYFKLFFVSPLFLLEHRVAFLLYFLVINSKMPSLVPLPLIYIVSRKKLPVLIYDAIDNKTHSDFWGFLKKIVDEIQWWILFRKYRDVTKYFYKKKALALVQLDCW